jgi:hypothetical protein
MAKRLVPIPADKVRGNKFMVTLTDDDFDRLTTECDQLRLTKQQVVIKALRLYSGELEKSRQMEKIKTRLR